VVDQFGQQSPMGIGLSDASRVHSKGWTNRWLAPTYYPVRETAGEILGSFFHKVGKGEARNSTAGFSITKIF